MKLLVLLFFCITSLYSVRAQSKSNPFILGTIDTLHSTVLGEDRVLNIYLPEGYNPDSIAAYPVIYLLDGSADEDFIHVVGLVQYNNFSWIDRFPKSIVVGIANINRRRDFTFDVPNLDCVEKMGFNKSGFTEYGKSEKFMNFIEKELQPHIEKNYKTVGPKTIIGQSLGGLLCTEILLKKPALFDTYIIMSPSLWWGNEELLQQAPQLLKANNFSKKRIYVGVGKEGNVMVNDAKKLSTILKDNKIETYFDYLPNEDHATMTHQAVYNAFKLLYPFK